MTAVTVFLSGSPCVSVRLFVTNRWDPVDGFSLYLVFGNFTRISYRIPVCLKFCSSIIFTKRTKNIERKLCNTYEASVLCSVHFYASFPIFSGAMKQTIRSWFEWISKYFTSCEIFQSYFTFIHSVVLMSAYQVGNGSAQLVFPCHSCPALRRLFQFVKLWSSSYCIIAHTWTRDTSLLPSWTKGNWFLWFVPLLPASV
jgi:hypothetical protein